MWETLRKEEVLQKLRTKQGVGLTQREVQVRKQKYGNNKLQEKKKKTLIIKFIKQFNDFMIIILIVASILSLTKARRRRRCQYSRAELSKV